MKSSVFGPKPSAFAAGTGVWPEHSQGADAFGFAVVQQTSLETFSCILLVAVRSIEASWTADVSWSKPHPSLMTCDAFLVKDAQQKEI